MREHSIISILFLGEPMAQLAYREDRGADIYALQFERSFVTNGHDLSPLNLPVEAFGSRTSVWRAGDTPFVGGLPGLIADSLPDAWGERMLARELPGLKTVLGKLAAIGPRGSGALTFEPILGEGARNVGTTASLSQLSKEAAELMKQPAQLDKGQVTDAMAKGGSTLGGAFPKISTHLPFKGDELEINEVMVGGPTPKGFRPSILKLTRTDDEAEGCVEYWFWLMAKKAGIRLPRACLVNDGERWHFAVERFDRYSLKQGTWGRRHVHSLAGLLHKRPADRAIDYEEFMRLSRRLGGAGEALECFRRIVFNLLAAVRDDHGRNHMFLYDHESRSWSLAPAFDLNPAVYNQLIALSYLGSAAIPSEFKQLEQLAEIGGITRRQALSVYREVEASVSEWHAAAKMAHVPVKIAALWGEEIVRQTKPLRDSARRSN